MGLSVFPKPLKTLLEIENEICTLGSSSDRVLCNRFC